MGVDNYDSSFDNIEGCIQLSLVVGETGNVKNVDLLATEFGVHKSGLDRVFAVELYFTIVTDGVLSINGSAAIDEATVEGHGFSHGGFSRFGTAYKGNVTDV